MKTILLLITILVFSCTPNEGQPKENGDLVGKWKLIEQFADPGDGSGDFQPIISDRIIEFFNDGTVIVNGELCFMESSTGGSSSGTYMITGSETADTTYDGEIIPERCSFDGVKVFFDLTSNGNLILWYLCIEGCGQKFEKIK